MDTKRIGNIGEAKILAKFAENQVPTYIPFGDDESEDLVVKINGKFYKIQVKTSIYARDGKMTFWLLSSRTHRKNGGKRAYQTGEVDFFACYNLQRDVSLLLPFSKFEGIKNATIRYSHTKNRQGKNVHYEEDYLFEKVLNEIKC